MFEAGSVSGFDSVEAVFPASGMGLPRCWSPPRSWISCSPATPWGVHDRSLSDGTCRRCGWVKE